MNRFLSILTLIVLVPFVPARSQTEERAILVDARLWTFGGDTVHTTIQYINQYSFQFRLTEADTAGTVMNYYSPKDIAGFSYSMKNEEIEFVSMLNPQDMGRLFMRVVYRGEYSLYQYLEINYKSTVLSYLVYYYLWDQKWIEPPITQQYEREALLYHFSDCPELEYKIKTGNYGLTKIKEILQEYENCRLTDEYEYFYE